MCGIIGIFHHNGLISSFDDGIIQMNKALQHRGPDDTGVYSDKSVSLGHQRLSIIDLSSDGHQPFVSENRNYVIVYNGELYNYKEIKLQIKEYPFRTKTDTEVILAAYIVFGEACLEMFNGMFSFAIWNKEKEELFIARDRVGIKHFTIQNKILVLCYPQR
ncbi:MAG: hypothetical protein JKY42_09265 [Flavobacteriales bacterium]|nr:hypothetical protein [Flavobacteriales bacterium]